MTIREISAQIEILLELNKAADASWTHADYNEWMRKKMIELQKLVDVQEPA